MDMAVHDTLAGNPADVKTDIVAIRGIFFADDRSGSVNDFEKILLLFCGGVKTIFDMAEGDHQHVSFRGREPVITGIPELIVCLYYFGVRRTEGTGSFIRHESSLAGREHKFPGCSPVTGEMPGHMQKIAKALNPFYQVSIPVRISVPGMFFFYIPLPV
jgi:hypothetical protein